MTKEDNVGNKKDSIEQFMKQGVRVQRTIKWARKQEGRKIL